MGTIAKSALISDTGNTRIFFLYPRIQIDSWVACGEKTTCTIEFLSLGWLWNVKKTHSMVHGKTWFSHTGNYGLCMGKYGLCMGCVRGR